MDFEVGLEAVEELKKLFPGDESLALWALRWVLMFDEVSCVIPGSSKVKHVEANVRAPELPSLTAGQMDGVKAVYEAYVKEAVHQRW